MAGNVGGQNSRSLDCPQEPQEYPLFLQDPAASCVEFPLRRQSRRDDMFWRGGAADEGGLRYFAGAVPRSGSRRDVCSLVCAWVGPLGDGFGAADLSVCVSRAAG